MFVHISLRTLFHPLTVFSRLLLLNNVFKLFFWPLVDVYSYGYAM